MVLVQLFTAACILLSCTVSVDTDSLESEVWSLTRHTERERPLNGGVLHKFNVLEDTVSKLKDLENKVKAAALQRDSVATSLLTGSNLRAGESSRCTAASS